MRDSNFVWIIKFNPKKQGEADLYIPAPPSFGGNWMKVRNDQEPGAEGLEWLAQIQEICEKIKDECEEQNPRDAAEAQEYLDRIKDVNHKLEDLDELFKKFNDFLKRLSNPPPE